MNRRRLLWIAGAAYLSTWILVSWLTLPSLDGYGDMVENYAWSQAWAWGTFKHPPLFAWIVGAWFTIMPTRTWAYFVLSYLNAGVGLIGIVRLANLLLPAGITPARRDAFAAVVALLAVLSFPYSNLAAKFNADTVLLSVWPWTAYAFFATLAAADVRSRLVAAVALGVLGAAAMLGKYYSGVLLASLFVISLSHRDHRRWYATAGPYVAAAVFALLLAPHAVWEMREGVPALRYIGTKIDPAISPSLMLAFLLSGIYYAPLSWMAWIIMRRRFGSIVTPVQWSVAPRSLWLLTVLPAIVTVLFNLFARVHLTTHWAIPIWFALPALLATHLLPRIGEDFPWRRFVRGFAAFCAFVLVAAVGYTIVLSATGDPRYSLGRPEMVRAIEGRFAERFPSRRLFWAGGTWPESGALAFFGSGHPRALPGLPDESPTLVNPYPAWRETPGVILCYAWPAYGRAGSHDTACEQSARDWLSARGRPVDVETVTYQADGWRFIRSEPRNATVFWVVPLP
ncbi:MAG TPA: glycosyltransferase family 39 protein [Vicinamibacterales bacterium]|nr:glycosyltransferase family 39 protein [Vicinamibacterales bacterium]